MQLSKLRKKRSILHLQRWKRKRPKERHKLTLARELLRRRASPSLQPSNKLIRSKRMARLRTLLVMQLTFLPLWRSNWIQKSTHLLWQSWTILTNLFLSQTSNHLQRKTKIARWIVDTSYSKSSSRKLKSDSVWQEFTRTTKTCRSKTTRSSLIVKTKSISTSRWLSG